MRYHRIPFILLLFLLMAGQAWATNTYATQRLQQIASKLYGVPFDTLSCGIHELDDGFYTLVIRVNRWQEIEHIGLKIFDRHNLATHQQVAYDFVERYVLELKMSEDEEAARNKMNNDNVMIEFGDLSDFLTLKQTDEFHLLSFGFKGYRFSWSREGLPFLSLSFPMNYELMSGCNAIELEHNYMRDIERYAEIETDIKDSLSSEGFYESDSIVGEYYSLDGGTYLSEAIRNTLYYKKDTTSWYLLCNARKPYWSAYNIALSSSPVGDFCLDGLLDQYGYETEPFSLPFHKWVSYCEQEGGKLYFGIKTVDSTCISGTIFIPYEDKGYCHLLKVDIPFLSIANQFGDIRGRLFVYVPLHNIHDEYFD